MDGRSIENNQANRQERIESRIAAACARVGRDRGSVRLVAVSKGRSVEQIKRAAGFGQRLFGENYIQEVTEKMIGTNGLEWHFIGALQSNKAKQAVGKFSLIHSVDRDSVAVALSKCATQMKLVQPVLVEVNLAAESGKAGVTPAELGEFLRRARGLPGLHVRGLMALPPAGSAEGSRQYFRTLRELLEQGRDTEFSELSMGTSQDFEVAIEEGATLVRVGTEFFGRDE